MGGGRAQLEQRGPLGTWRGLAKRGEPPMAPEAEGALACSFKGPLTRHLQVTSAPKVTGNFRQKQHLESKRLISVAE